MNWPEAVVAATGIFCGAVFLVAVLGFFAIVATGNSNEEDGS